MQCACEVYAHHMARVCIFIGYCDIGPLVMCREHKNLLFAAAAAAAAAAAVAMAETGQGGRRARDILRSPGQSTRENCGAGRALLGLWPAL